jgi:hypothetical protein
MEASSEWEWLDSRPPWRIISPGFFGLLLEVERMEVYSK